ncbi:MAG: AAA family ATPase, partial [Limisphaerales bacterium]
ANGETLDLSGFYIVFTTNIGGADLLNLQHSTFATMERHVLARAQQAMRPELFARITEKLVFNRLSYDHQLEIAQLLLDGELRFLREKGHELQVDRAVLPFVVQRGFHPKLGARPMRDAVEKLIGDAVSMDLLKGGTGCGQLVVEEDGGLLSVRKCPLEIQAAA